MTETPIKYEAGAVEPLIHTVRGQKVILDADLATLYGVETKNLNKAISRNKRRFPDDFAFRLTRQEVMTLRFQNGTSNEGRGGRRYPPYAFTEHGAIMAANVLRSRKAEEMSVFVVRAFVKMRQALLAQHEQEKRLTQIEKVLLVRDHAVKDIYQKLRPLLLPPELPPRKPIGFGVREARGQYRTASHKAGKPARRT